MACVSLVVFVTLITVALSTIVLRMRLLDIVLVRIRMGFIFYESQCAGYSTTPMPTNQPSKSGKKSKKRPKKDKENKRKEEETDIFD